MNASGYQKVGAARVVAVLLAVTFVYGGRAPAARAAERSSKLPDGVPARVAKVLKYVDKHDRAPEGHIGGRTFENRERRLPKKDAHGKAVVYREWDVNPKVRGKDRGPERLITGSDGSAYYTLDHYKHFKKIR